jgi:hypothetical protein
MVDAEAAQKKSQQHAYHLVAAHRFVLHLKDLLRIGIGHRAHRCRSSEKPTQPYTLLLGAEFICERFGSFSAQPSPPRARYNPAHEFVSEY